MYASSAKITASPIMTPMSRSQFAGRLGPQRVDDPVLGGLISLRFTVVAAAAKPQRDGAIIANCLSPGLLASGTT